MYSFQFTNIVSIVNILEGLKVPTNIYFSGRGFHFGIPETAFRWAADANLHVYLKKELTAKGIYEYADVSVSDKTRLIRVVNTLNSKSRLWKIPLKNQRMP